MGGAPKRRPQPSARLVCQAGPAEGEEFALEGDELSLGRAADNPIALSDDSVSRKHALIRNTGVGWAISDLGSGNGTMLNGEVIADETELSEGDVITIGETELRFESMAPAQARAPAPEPAEEEVNPADTGSEEFKTEEQPSALARRPPVRTARVTSELSQASRSVSRSGSRGPRVRTSRGGNENSELLRQQKKKTVVRLVAVLVALVSVSVGAYAIHLRRIERERRAQLDREAHNGELADLFKDAKALVKKRQWTEAREKLLEIQQTDPDFATRQVTNYIDIAEKEIPNQVVINQATAAVKAGELAKAAVLLKNVKVTPQAEDAVHEVHEAMDTRAAERLAEARALASTRDLSTQERVKAIAEDVLAVREDDREAAEVKRAADAVIFALKNPSVAPTPVETPWVEVQNRFKNGDPTGAIALAQACANRQPKCHELESQIHEWDQKSKKVEDLGENELITLFDLDRRIAGGVSSEQSKPIRTQLVSKLFVKASQLKTTQNWSRAIEYARKVLQADPNHAGAQALIADARSQAKDVYLRAYQLKDNNPDEAAKLFKDVLNMTPPDDEYSAKARARLKDLQQQ